MEHRRPCQEQHSDQSSYYRAAAQGACQCRCCFHVCVVPVSSGAPADGGLKRTPMKHDVFRSALLIAGQSSACLWCMCHAFVRSCCRPGVPLCRYIHNKNCSTLEGRSQARGLVHSCSSLGCHGTMLLSGTTCDLTAGYRVPSTHATCWE